MKFTKENCLGDDHGKAFAMALLEKSGLEIDEEDTIVDLFTVTINERVKFFFILKTYSIYFQIRCHQLKKNALCLILNLV